MKKVFYEVWGQELGSTEVYLLFKFPVPHPSDPESEEDVKRAAQQAADEMRKNGARQVEVRRVEE